MKAVPRLHVVTDREILERPDFLAAARAVLSSYAAGTLVLHLRARGASGRLLLDRLRELQVGCPDATLLVNDRVDVARIAGVGAHLPETGLTPPQARTILGKAALLGRSVHEPPWEAPGAGDLDYLVYGHVFGSGSKQGLPPRGLSGLDRAVREGRRLGLPVIAIGGVTPERVASVLETGALGVAAISGVWDASDPTAAAGRYLDALAAAAERFAKLKSRGRLTAG